MHNVLSVTHTSVMLNKLADKEGVDERKSKCYHADKIFTKPHFITSILMRSGINSDNYVFIIYTVF